MWQNGMNILKYGYKKSKGEHMNSVLFNTT